MFFTNLNAQSIKVAVAANFAQPMKALIKTYELQSQTRVKLITGSSGKLYAQIMHGAPFDLFFSADQEKVTRLKQNDKLVASSIFTYAQGHLVLWSKNTEKSPLQRLKSGEFNYVALANPKHAPYGLAAVDYLSDSSVDTINKRIIGENIAQAFQYAYSGSADLGFVALSQVSALPEKLGRFDRISSQSMRPILQDAALLKQAQNNIRAIEFLTFVKSPAGQEIIQKYGYTNRLKGLE